VSDVASRSADPRTADALAAVRYRGVEQAGHVESWFLEAGDAEGQRGVLFMWTILSTYGGAALAEAWAVVFERDGAHVAVKESVPFERATFDAQRLAVDVAGCALRTGASRGDLETGARRVTWDVRYDVLAPPLAHLPASFLYEGRVPPQKLASPHPDVRLRGMVKVGAREVSVDGWRGVVGHNWGSVHARAWTWAHAAAWDGDDELVFEGVSGRPRVGILSAPPIALFSVRHRGLRYDLNGPRALARSKTEATSRRWRFAGAGPQMALEGELWAETDDFVGLHYANPQGPPVHCLHTKLARGRLTLRVRGGPPRTFHTRGAALELGTSDPHHGVGMAL